MVRRLPYADYVGLEATADSIRDYGLAVVPGLLQASDYARLLRADGPTLTPELVEQRVETRMDRQCLLHSPLPGTPAFTAVLDESVLHRSSRARP
jgi:hypothetical protein